MTMRFVRFQTECPRLLAARRLHRFSRVAYSPDCRRSLSNGVLSPIADARGQGGSRCERPHTGTSSRMAGRSNMKARDKRHAEKHCACRDLVPSDEESEAWHRLTPPNAAPSSLRDWLACAWPSPDRALVPPAAAAAGVSISQSGRDQDRRRQPERPRRPC